ncbi:MAG TPA: dTDP-glucose 4,6-dehydratase [Actinomycetota bacterium]|nr:dTDP-glucose 4,6-dehydratase [Actinomycetota bacterium]
MTDVLVTGGAGFIGSHFVDAALAGAADRITVLDALTYAGTRENLAHHDADPRVRLVEGDVADPDAVDPLVAASGLVVNFAAESFVDRSIADARPFAVTNVLGTHTLLEAALRHGVPMVQVSTDEVYGSTPEGAFTEDSPLRPNNPYAATKAGADLLCRSFHRTYGIDVRIMRGPNAYGPRQHPEKAIPTFAVAALEGSPLPVYGDGSNRREWLYVEDFARAVLAVIEGGAPGEVYNAGGGHEVANVDLARAICRLAGAPEDLVTFVEDRPGHDFRYSMVWDRLAALGWKPEVEFEDGLARTVAWYRDHPERWLPR